ncbi:NAD(P)-binding protein [Aspergillus keveii]|uniref:NAD(P)-binding protein n=1 Tax=Aspergillus keveii TaxID=714993 RepID=A0ABR4FKN7_9EURO
MDSLKGKVIIVTGAASGIGLATAQTLLGFGAKVFACDIRPKPDTLASSESLEFLTTNLTKPNVPEEVAEKTLKRFGKVDALLNIAGVMDTNNSVDTLTDELWDRCISINLTAPVKLMRAVLPHMIRAGGGSIVNVASKAGISGGTAGVAYTASKHGILGATKNVAYRFRGDRIRCNATCPGGVKTNIQQSINLDNMDTTASDLVKPVHALSNVNGLGTAEPSAHADVLAFLVSDMSSEINGAIIPVDYGWSVI